MHSSSIVLRSQSTNILLTKFWGPLLCIAATFGIFANDFLSWRVLLALPLIIGALFGISTAAVELRDGVLRYRRLFQWTTIPHGEIVAAGVIWHPLIGYVRLKRPIFPWGRLYFVLDKNLRPNPFRPGDYALLQYLRNETISPQPPENPTQNRALRANGLVFVAGIASSFMLNYLIPAYRQTISGQAYSTFLAMTVHIWQRATAWPWAMLTAVLLAVLVVRQPFAKFNWILTWGIGFMLAQMIVTAIH
jgi:hypothetical protein